MIKSSNIKGLYKWSKEESDCRGKNITRVADRKN